MAVSLENPLAYCREKVSGETASVSNRGTEGILAWLLHLESRVAAGLPEAAGGWLDTGQTGLVAKRPRQRRGQQQPSPGHYRDIKTSDCHTTGRALGRID